MNESSHNAGRQEGGTKLPGHYGTLQQGSRNEEGGDVKHTQRSSLVYSSLNIGWDNRWNRIYTWKGIDRPSDGGF